MSKSKKEQRIIFYKDRDKVEATVSKDDKWLQNLHKQELEELLKRASNET
ncbi:MULTISPECIES: hypothetical protein [Lactococcus]|uniref:Phage protein n=1 Tax=Lactococcus fujiensis JCM 16395 TaxID=1291764 RepID=A0A2A5RHV2_9LACT|nr:hypothetical protein [Lactococcus fujiensis]PCR98674.1 hypothetical protein RT41_GL001200 [Lactococcus fujiensis JCM 16395]